MSIFLFLTFALSVLFPLVSYRIGHIEYFLNYGLLSDGIFLVGYLIISFFTINFIRRKKQNS